MNQNSIITNHLHKRRKIKILPAAAPPVLDTVLTERSHYSGGFSPRQGAHQRPQLRCVVRATPSQRGASSFSIHKLNTSPNSNPLNQYCCRDHTEESGTQYKIIAQKVIKAKKVIPKQETAPKFKYKKFYKSPHSILGCKSSRVDSNDDSIFEFNNANSTSEQNYDRQRQGKQVFYPKIPTQHKQSYKTPQTSRPNFQLLRIGANQSFEKHSSLAADTTIANDHYQITNSSFEVEGLNNSLENISKNNRNGSQLTSSQKLCL